jgi:hypothetical protein
MLWHELQNVHSEQIEAYAAGPATPGAEKKSDRKEDGKAVGFVVSSYWRHSLPIFLSFSKDELP